MLGTLFQRNSPLAEVNSPDGILHIFPGDALLKPYKSILCPIQTIIGVPDAHWERLYKPMFEALARFVQHLPASEAHHHADPGGLLRHSLEVVLEALKLRRRDLLPPGATAEQLARLHDVWTYACIAAALLHDIGKPLVDQKVTLYGSDQTQLGQWNPIAGPIEQPAHYYRVEFLARRNYRRHERVAPLLARYIVPAEGLCWLANEPEAMDAWLATLQGDYEEAGPLGAIISKADGLSVARDLSGGSRIRMPSARSKPLAERLVTALRHLLAQDELPLNRRGAAGFLAGEDIWLVSKRVLDAIKEHLAREGQTGVPSRNDRLMDELQQRGLLIPNDDRAVWTCEVRIGDWAQRLTLLRMEVSTLWPDPERRPDPLDGSVTPVTDDESAEESNETHQPDNSEATDPDRPDTQPADSFHGLPLPYDITAEESAVRADSTPPPSDGLSTGARRKESATSHDTAGGDDEDPGQRFIAWLKGIIASSRVEINTVRARIHVLQEGLALVSPGIFRDFDATNWNKAQKRFQKLKLHLKRPDGTNIWTCRVAKDRKQSLIKVILIPEPEKALGVKLPPPNPAVTLLDEDRGKAKESSDG
ncbi:MAG: MobH family relaxase [Candidatus Thiodiazotropha sp.]